MVMAFFPPGWSSRNLVTSYATLSMMTQQSVSYGGSSQAIEAADADMACAASGGRHHPVFALWPVRLAADLREAVTREGLRKVDDWTSRYAQVRVEFSAVPNDPFFNINRPEDLATAETLLRRRSGGEVSG